MKKISAVLALLAAAATASATVYYVSPGGNDGNNGLADTDQGGGVSAQNVCTPSRTSSRTIGIFGSMAPPRRVRTFHPAR